MREFYRHIKILKQQNEDDFVRATVTEVIGSAYRHEGATMFFGKDGRHYGTLSAGCLEEDLSYYVADVFASSSSKLVEYDLTSEHDLIWGTGAGCNGKIKILLEPFGWNLIPPNHSQPVLPLIEELLDDGKSVCLAKSMEGKVASGTMVFCTNDGVMTDNTGNKEMKQKMLSHLIKFSASGAPFQCSYLPDLESTFLFERLKPKDALYIFGAGPDVEPVVKQAAALDFSTTVIDPSSTRCNRKFFPSSDALINEHPEGFFKKYKLRENCFVLLMTHNFTRDLQILEGLKEQSPPCYIGILGHKERLNRLQPPKQLLPHVHSPVGLKIGAEGPEEISISIMAQLIQVRNQTLLRNQIGVSPGLEWS